VAELATAERRIVLSRDKGLLMQKTITHGCYVRATRPLEQLTEILRRLDLYRSMAPFTLCLVCNVPLRTLTMEEARQRVPAGMTQHHRHFQTCCVCERVFWAGSHFRHLCATLEGALRESGSC
jgi:uncharacterized protein with PIN domain